MFQLTELNKTMKLTLAFISPLVISLANCQSFSQTRLAQRQDLIRLGFDPAIGRQYQPYNTGPTTSISSVNYQIAQYLLQKGLVTQGGVEMAKKFVKTVPTTRRRSKSRQNSFQQRRLRLFLKHRKAVV